MSYENLVAELAELEELQPDLFEPTAAVPASVCNLILSLALVYNDLRNVMMSHMLLNDVRPLTALEISPARGNYGGLRSAVQRLQAGIVFELLKLIEENQKAIGEASFQELVRKLSRDARAAWEALVAAALGEPKSDPVTKALLFFRNKVSFHYDAKEIKRGLALYLEKSKDKRLFISRGGGLAGTRMYFADAAAESYLRQFDADPMVKEFLEAQGELIDNVNRALYELVTRFPAHKGHAFRRLRSGV